MSTWLFDIDGTLSNDLHRQHHLNGDTKDWDSYYAGIMDDTPIAETVGLLRALVKSGQKVQLITGRPYKYEELTNKWLIEHAGPATSNLIMRQKDDASSNWEFKLRRIEYAIRCGYRFAGFFDDNIKAVKAVSFAYDIPCFLVKRGQAGTTIELYTQSVENTVVALKRAFEGGA